MGVLSLNLELFDLLELLDSKPGDPPASPGLGHRQQTTKLGFLTRC